MAEAAQQLRIAIRDAFDNVRQNFPIPIFTGKDKDKPEHHCLKFEDWLDHLGENTTPLRADAADDAAHAEALNEFNLKQAIKFKTTLKGKPRQWFEALPAAAKTSYSDIDGDKRLKTLFCERWSLKGKTQDALYAEWQALSFDPAKDDIEEFIGDVVNIAQRLNYPENARIIAIRNALPLQVFNSCHHIDTLDELKDYLIKVFDNPRMKKLYSQPDSSAGIPGALTVATSVPSTSKEPKPEASTDLQSIGKLTSSINKLQSSFNQIKSKPPYKPRITQSRGRGNNNFRSQRRFNNFRPRNRYNNFNNNHRYQNFNNNNRGRYSPRPYQNRRRFQSSPNTKRPRVAGKPIDKDKDRCFYCKEYGHFIKNCPRKVGNQRYQNKFSTIQEQYGESEYLDEFIEDPLQELSENISSLNM